MKFALAGNPNSGKTTLFNNLTGSTARVGNWPGVTVDRKEGTYKGLEKPVTIIDLPGIYSLSPYTPEEVVARNYIIEENPDLIINIVDGTNLERNLYLTTQILETDIPVVVALNMMDTVDKQGAHIDINELEKMLGVPVVPISALRNTGIKELMQLAAKTVGVKRTGNTVLSQSGLAGIFDQVVALVKQKDMGHQVFHAVKMLEEDQLEVAAYPELVAQVKELKESVADDVSLGGDFEAAIADLRYKHISKYSKKIIRGGVKQAGGLSQSDKIDKVLTNRWLGLPIFFFLMFVVFHLTFTENLLFFTEIASPGVFLQGLTETLIEFVSEGVEALLEAAGASDWILGLVVDGLLAGVGAVLSFVPQIMLLFLFLSIMEDSGYMARAAFIMDRLLRRFGLSGKSFIPLLMGFGCSVPAIGATRTLENDRDRKLTIMLMTGFSCGAKFPIWATFAAAVFPDNPDVMVFAIYLIGIVFALLAGIILSKTLFKGDAAPFIMELPAYHWPQFKSLMIHLWAKLKGYLVRAGTIIAAATIVIWFLANFSFSLQMVEPNSLESILGVLGNFVRPIFVPLGFASGPDGWKPIVAILTGLIAKEMVVSTMGVLYNPSVAGDAFEDESANAALITTLAAAFSPAAALSFMVFNLLCVPCMAAVAAARAELNSAKWLWGTILFWMVLAYIASFIVFTVSSFIFG